MKRKIDKKTKKINEHIAKRVKLKRTELRYTASYIAKEVLNNMPPPNYDSYENGQTMFKAWMIYKLAKVFNVSTDWFFEEL